MGASLYSFNRIYFILFGCVYNMTIFYVMHDTFMYCTQEIMHALDRFSLYHHIWKKDREETIQKFIQGNPLLSEFEFQILYYKDLELEINTEPEFISVGALALYTGRQTLNQ